MGTGETVVSLGIVAGIAAGLFFFRDGIKNAFASPEQKAADAKKTEASAEFDKQVTKSIGDITNAITGTTKGQEKDTLNKFNQQVQFKEGFALGVGFPNVESFERATDTNQDVTKFNPKGIVGFGIKSINDGKGVPIDSPEGKALIAHQETQKAIFSGKRVTLSDSQRKPETLETVKQKLSPLSVKTNTRTRFSR